MCAQRSKDTLPHEQVLQVPHERGFKNHPQPLQRSHANVEYVRLRFGDPALWPSGWGQGVMERSRNGLERSSGPFQLQVPGSSSLFGLSPSLLVNYLCPFGLSRTVTGARLSC